MPKWKLMLAGACGQRRHCIELQLHGRLHLSRTRSLTLLDVVHRCAAGGIGFWTFAFPQDLIKSIIQTHTPPPQLTTSPASPTLSTPSPSFLSTARDLVAREGVGRLWRGFPVALFRGIPGAAITFTTYTTVMQNMNRQGW